MVEYLGKRTPKGKQIAVNKSVHMNVQLFENESGEYYPVIQQIDRPILIRGEYHPIGNKLQFPKHWGDREGALTLLNHRIEQQTKILEDTQKELEKLTACRSKVEGWNE